MREMTTVAELLDGLQQQLQLPSDNQVAKELGISQSTISAWRSGRAVPREMHALVIAEALKVSPMLVMAIAVADKTRDKKVRDGWTKLVRQLARAGLPALAAFLVSTKSYMPPKKVDDVSVHILSNRRRKRRVTRPTDMLQAA